MRLAIMQPYFLSYIGYFQLIAAVDEIILYDNIKYTKKGWINRNRLLLDGKDAKFTLPLKHGSDTLDICEREIAEDFNKQKFLNQISGAYGRAPQFTATFPLIEEIVRYGKAGLFDFIHNSVVRLCEHLRLRTRILVSSGVSIDHGLKGEAKVIALCKARGAATYINLIGGVDLYSRDDFAREGILLKFVKSSPFEYRQFGQQFVPWLSIIDILMFNTVDAAIEQILTGYELI